MLDAPLRQFRRFAGPLLMVALLAGACSSSTTVTTATEPAGSDASAGADVAVEATAPPAASDSEEEPVATAAEDPTPTDPADPTDPTDDSVDAEPPRNDGVIGTANMNGEVVDPKAHAIDSFSIAESYPEQISLIFTAGDANCLAADAAAIADGDQVVISLQVGITTDALTRSCQAALFEHRLMIPLTEGLNGREVVLEVVEVAAGDEPVTEPPPQDFASTLIGMSAAAAEEGAASFGYRWRVMSLDGEAFFGTTDFDEQRVNVAIEDGVVVDAWLG